MHSTWQILTTQEMLTIRTIMEIIVATIYKDILQGSILLFERAKT